MPNFTKNISAQQIWREFSDKLRTDFFGKNDFERDMEPFI